MPLGLSYGNSKRFIHTEITEITENSCGNFPYAEITSSDANEKLSVRPVFTNIDAEGYKDKFYLWWSGYEDKKYEEFECDSLTFIDIRQTEDYVDLGLSVKWATCNLGAKDPEDLGNYYAWGETKPKTEYNFDNYKFSSYDSHYNKRYDKYNQYDNRTVLDSEDDVATTTLGAPWRMPTVKETNELINECKWGRYYKYNDIADYGYYGYIVYGPNGNYIYLPLAGYKSSRFWGGTYNPESYAGCYFWTSEVCIPDSSSKEYDSAYSINIANRRSYEPSEADEHHRYDGLVVRPVQP